MVFDKQLFCELTQKAKESSRLRYSFDLRNSAEDQSQRMFNALEPGTNIPIHRHTKTSETIIVIRGALTEFFYDDNGNIIDSFRLVAGGEMCGLNIPENKWHSIRDIESGTIIIEMKDGAYFPLKEEDVLNTNL